MGFVVTRLADLPEHCPASFRFCNAVDDGDWKIDVGQTFSHDALVSGCIVVERPEDRAIKCSVLDNQAEILVEVKYEDGIVYLGGHPVLSLRDASDDDRRFFSIASPEGILRYAMVNWYGIDTEIPEFRLMKKYKAERDQARDEYTRLARYASEQITALSLDLDKQGAKVAEKNRQIERLLASANSLNDSAESNWDMAQWLAGELSRVSAEKIRSDMQAEELGALLVEASNLLDEKDDLLISGAEVMLALIEENQALEIVAATHENNAEMWRGKYDALVYLTGTGQ